MSHKDKSEIPTTAPVQGPTPVITPADLFDAGPAEGARAIWLQRDGTPRPEGLAASAHWLDALAYVPAARKQALLPGEDGGLAGVVLGLGDGAAGDPSGPSELLVGQLAQTVPGGLYHLANAGSGARMAALAWGLGGYRYRRYKQAAGDPPARLVWPEGVDRASVLAMVEAIWLGRDLINTPASDMGPDELENAARTLAARHGATVATIAGDDLLTRNFPLIHAVGRASTRAPRLIDLTWGPSDAPKVTLVGKGICFDTGGLDIKPSSGMLLMKKDMGGAATALALGHMIMAHKLNVRLRLLIPAAENSIAGNAFRPSDVIASRLGPTVEIGNTDAEGRLVLADALALADEESPNQLFTFSTLTGAARVALGPDLPAFFTDSEALASDVVATGRAIGDPVWRMPFWPGYERSLESEVADMNNVSESPFSGAIIAALFLKRFVKRAPVFAHFDLYGWRPIQRPLGPKGGEPQTARAVFEVLSREHGA
jgi:leucyl aminopeptidase